MNLLCCRVDYLQLLPVHRYRTGWDDQFFDIPTFYILGTTRCEVGCRLLLWQTSSDLSLRGDVSLRLLKKKHDTGIWVLGINLVFAFAGKIALGLIRTDMQDECLY